MFANEMELPDESAEGDQQKRSLSLEGHARHPSSFQQRRHKHAVPLTSMKALCVLLHLHNDACAAVYWRLGRRTAPLRRRPRRRCAVRRVRQHRAVEARRRAGHCDGYGEQLPRSQHLPAATTGT